MNAFVCLIGHPAHDHRDLMELLDTVARRRTGRAHEWATDGALSIATTRTLARGVPPAIVRSGPVSAVGIVRLDNSASLAKRAAMSTTAPDLAILTAALVRHGLRILDELSGEATMVMYNHRTHETWAVRDAVGIRALFMTRLSGGAIAFASHGGLLATRNTYDRDYITEFLISGTPGASRCVYSGVEAIQGGHVCTVRDGVPRTHAHWQPSAITRLDAVDVSEAVTTFRRLFEDGVHACMVGASSTWSDLSGGQDSSAVVVTAKHLADHDGLRPGLAGTITLVDDLSKHSDERAYSRAITAATGIRNVEVPSVNWLYDDGEAPPATDEPCVSSGFYARQRSVNRALESAGAAVLLSGLGADHYLSCKKPVFLADLVARGRLASAAKGALLWAVAGRTSVWQMAWKRALYPLLPNVVRRQKALRREVAPAWLTDAFRKGDRVDERLTRLVQYDAPRGHLYGTNVAQRVQALSVQLRHGAADQAISIRYPFLYRPLIDYCLNLPFWLCAQPKATKWILRAAMAERLPALVRDRRQKSTIGARLRHSLIRERETVDYLLTAPVLGDLGFIDTHPLRDALRRVQQGSAMSVNAMMRCLTLEFWLRVDCGRWAVRANRSGRP
jgi:asparagine synthetase B (glutamine-hydrolysing)